SSETLLNATLDWVYPEELGHRTAAWFSPDSKHIAYLQMDQTNVPRYRVPGILPLRSQGREMFYPKAGDPNPKVRIGVVPVKGGETRWLPFPKSAEYVLQVSWRTDRDGRHDPYVLYGNRAQSVMWSHQDGIDVGTLRTRSGWLSNQLSGRWIGPERRLVRWKPDATRWYIFDAKDIQDPEQFHQDVTPKGVDANRVLHIEPTSGAVLYSGIVHGEVTQGVFVGGPGVKGIHRAPFAKDATKWTSASVDHSGTYALVTTSDALTPQKTVLARVKDGQVVREIGSAYTKKLDTLKLAVPEYGRIPVEGHTGEIQWRLWKPHDFDPKKRYGLIVHVYGGPGSNMVRNRWGRGPLMQTMLCDKGYLVLQVDGRGSGGQGTEWLYSVYGKLGVLEIEDQATAVQAILKRGYVDPERVGIWGWSYGGTMACNGLTMRPDVFKAGVAVAPVTDWKLYDTIYTERYMGLPKDNADGYKQSSAITHVKKMTGHLLLMHGISDDNVHVQNTLRLQEAFIKAGKLNYDVMLYPRRGHGIGGASLDVFTRLVAWFDEHIGGR
nr:prolyl oligopeptidase family serine peptidase [Planctomycetota bacterium]